VAIVTSVRPGDAHAAPGVPSFPFMAEGRDRVLVAAILANVGIAILKFVAAAFTGSAAMASEGIHSLVDTGNGALMRVGLRRSGRPPDEAHPFGHGKELYFWTFVVAVTVFAVGGGMSIYEGVQHLVHPRPIENLTWSYAVLGASVLLEGASWVTALRLFAGVKGRRGVWQTIRGTKDPTNFAVLLEDTAALAGLLVAFLGISLGQALRWPALDAVASLVIGLLLAGVAVVMARESMGLLVGESASRRLVASARALAATDPSVERVGRVLSVHFGPQAVLLNLEVRFRPETSLPDLRAAIQRIERTIQGGHPEVRWVFFAAESLAHPPLPAGESELSAHPVH
jgi:cation diffusion facilitator family transporter